MKTISNKICFVLPKFVTFSTGGAELQVYFLSEEFLRNGWEVELLVSNLGNKKQITQSSFYNPRITCRFYKLHPWFRTLEFLSVFFKLFTTSSSFYYQRTDHALTGAVALYCKLFRKKMIYAVACDDELKKKKYAAEFLDFPYNSKLKKIIRSIDVKLIDYLVEYGKNNAHKVLTQTNYQKQGFENNFGRKAYLIRNSFPFRPDKKQQKENIILWVANFRPFKQADIFIRLAEALKTIGWKFVMMGEIDGAGQKEHYSRLFEEVTNKNFEYIGHVSYSESLDWFEKARILVNTSLFEGFSNTFIQAWVCKTLLISMNADPDLLISEKGYGILSGKDELQLKNAVLKATNAYNEFSDSVNAAYEFALREFDIKNNFKKLNAIIADENPAC